MMRRGSVTEERKASKDNLRIKLYFICSIFYTYKKSTLRLCGQLKIERKNISEGENLFLAFSR
jgi:hypothetical protein